MSNQNQLLVRTNAYLVRWPVKNGRFVYHYDVVITPLFDFHTKDGRERKLGHRKGTELMMRLQQEVDPNSFPVLGSYDGKKNLFAFQKYSFDSQAFEVPFDPHSSRKNRKASIKITFVTAINMQVLSKINDKPESLAGTSTCLTMLNLFFQSAPRMQNQTVHNSKSFFTSHGKRTHHRLGPLELWRGYYQSVRLGTRDLIVNVDCTIGVVLPPKQLHSVCMEFLQLRNNRDLLNLKSHLIGRLRLYLKDVKVTVETENRGPKTIKDFIPDVYEYKFEKNGETISVGDHFVRTYNKQVPRGTLGVKLGRDGIFPVTVCTTVQQLYKNRTGLSPDVVRESLEFTPSDPARRLEEIQRGLTQLRYPQSQFLVGAGITVDAEPIELPARLLPDPTIRFQGGQAPPRNRRGVWDVMGKVLMEPGTLRTMAVVDFTGFPNLHAIENFVQALMQGMSDRGIQGLPSKMPQLIRGNPQTFERVMKDAATIQNIQLLLVLLPESAAALYTNVKRFGDIEVGIVSQCVKWSHRLSQNATAPNKRGALDQYVNNLILKINLKIGGKNFYPDGTLRYLRNDKVPTMILGADVSHPGPGSRMPSVSALVASVDEYFLKYVASTRIQESRTEMIRNIKDMLNVVLHTFKDRNGFLPGRLIMFRDGVSEGEFLTVQNEEVAQIKEALAEMYTGTKFPMPKLIFLVVGKRHHFRFFPKDNRSADRSGNGNVQAGLLIDSVIRHPVYDDFYLQSQPGLKGTSRPSHYTVLVNEEGVKTQNLQELAYALCHCFSRATRSVKMPAPVYYADLVCRRARFHFDQTIGYEEIDERSSDSHGRGEKISLLEEHFHHINSRLQQSMYFV